MMKILDEFELLDVVKALQHFRKVNDGYRMSDEEELIEAILVKLTEEEKPVFNTPD